MWRAASAWAAARVRANLWLHQPGRRHPRKRSVRALASRPAGGSFGQFAIVPFVSLLQVSARQTGIRTMFILGVVSMVMVPLAFGLREQRSAAPKPRGSCPARHQRPQLQEGVPDAGLLAAHYRLSSFAGFHVTFIGLHLPSYISDRRWGMSFFGTRVSALELGGWAIGPSRPVSTSAGSLIWGWLGSRHPKKDMLALLITPCALIAFMMFLALPLSWMSVLLFSASLGFLWLGHRSAYQRPSSVTCSVRRTYRCYGAIVFFSHQLGSFLGGWAPAGLYDIQGQLRSDVVDRNRARARFARR